MRSLAIAMIVFLTQSCSTPVLADDYDTQNGEWFGMGFAATTVVYRIFRNGFGMPKGTASLFALAVVTPVQLAWQFRPGPLWQQTGRAMTFGQLGNGAALLTFSIGD